jgi:xylulokinase
MSPSIVLIDGRGRAISPVLTHQDRRSLVEARDIARIVGDARHLEIVGNAPVPGGCGSTSLLWFARHAPALLKRAKLIGNVSTLLLNALAGARAIDPSHAGFTGLFHTDTQTGWCDELAELAGVRRDQLPIVHDASELVCDVSAEGSRAFGLPRGMPCGAGIVDGSCAMLLAGARPGAIVNVVGSTDVLARCVDRYAPRAGVITRPLGTRGLWVEVCTIAAAGAALDWVHRVCFSEMSAERFFTHVARAARDLSPPRVACAPWLAGSRTEIEPPPAYVAGLTLGTTRHDLLHAVVHTLADESAKRLERLGIDRTGTPQPVLLSGGARSLRRLMHARWPGSIRFRSIEHATIRGLGAL